MNEPADSTRYGDREFALILEKAAELQARDAPGALRRGHTRREIEEIAAEAGIEERYVRQAIALVGQRPASPWSRLAGSPSHVQSSRSLPGTLSNAAITAVVDALQAEMGQPGSAREVLGGVEWTARDAFGPVQAVVRPVDGETRILVGADRRETAAMLHILLPIGGLVLGGVLGAAISPLPVAAGVAAAGVGGMAAARIAWAGVVKRWRARLERMLDRAVSAADQAESAPSTSIRGRDP